MLPLTPGLAGGPHAPPDEPTGQPTAGWIVVRETRLRRREQVRAVVLIYKGDK